MSGPWGLIATIFNQMGKQYSTNDESMRRNQWETYRNRGNNMVYSQPVPQPQQYTGPGKTAGDISDSSMKAMGIIGGDPMRNQILKPALEGEKALMNPTQAPIAGAYAKSTGPYNSLDAWMKYRTRRI